MKVIVTGASGTIGSVLCELLKSKDIEVVTWNRQQVPIDDYQRMEAFVRSVEPDILFHLAYAPQHYSSSETWRVNYEWTSELAWITRTTGVRFLFTSTNLVFTDKMQGPYTIHSIPDAEEGYGYEKRKAEERVFQQNPDALVVRLGWQIGKEAGSNNMIDYLVRKMKEEGEVKASIYWKPACSFLEDTCEKLLEIGISYTPGLYMLDSNERWNFYEITNALNRLHNYTWKITTVENYFADTRMIDERVRMVPLSQRLTLP